MTTLVDYLEGRVDLDALPPSLRDPKRWPEADQLELLRRVGVGPTESFVEYVDRITNGRIKWYQHARQLADVLQRVADGDLHRVIVSMPPRHGKTEIVSRLFSAYYLHRHPDRFVALTSYGAGLSYPISRSVRENFAEGGGELAHDAKSVKAWNTSAGGGLWATGIGGPATGKGFHLGVIDDPVKDAQEAESPAIQKRNRDWFDSVFTTREEPGGAIIVIMTRWNEADLVGYILDKENDAPEGWHIVRMEAIKETEPGDYDGDPNERPAYFDTCTFEPDPRELGAPLCARRYDLHKLRRLRLKVGPYFWEALYQQNPKPRQGNMLRRDWFEIVDALPLPAGWSPTPTPVESPNPLDNWRDRKRQDPDRGPRSAPTGPRVRFVRYWDKAGTEGGGAYTAGVLMAMLETKAPGFEGKTPVTVRQFFIVDVVMGQWEATRREAKIREVAIADRERWGRVVIGVEQEPGSGGLESADNTVRNLAGFTVVKDRPSGSKVLRADPLATQAGAGNVKMLRGDWNRRALDIFAGFPTGKYKDVVDAAAGAFALLTRGADKVGSKKYA